MGVASGLPVYRTPADFLSAHPAHSALGLTLPQLSNVDLFRQDPELAWGFYWTRLKEYREVQYKT